MHKKLFKQISSVPESLVAQVISFVKLYFQCNTIIDYVYSNSILYLSVFTLIICPGLFLLMLYDAVLCGCGAVVGNDGTSASGFKGIIVLQYCLVVPDVEVHVVVCQGSSLHRYLFYLSVEGIAACEFSAGFRSSELSYFFLPAPLLRC